jgi:hypothetical protein
MKVRRTVFDSESERNLFAVIESRWSQRGFVLYPSLPFANIFDITTPEVTPEERSFLLKTSIDYTLCTKEGRPLVSVEFDGISHGFSRHGAYVAVREAPSRDPRRHWKLDLKVRLATQADYPLLVVSYHEKNPISQDIHLTIVDGAIGQVLAKRAFHRLVNEHFSAVEHTLAGMSSDEAQEYVQDMVLGLEVDADLEWNPLAKAAAIANCRLLESGISSSYRLSYLDPPGMPGSEDLLARADALKRRVWVGCRITHHTGRGPASAEARVRNMEHAGVHPLGLAEDIAMLLAAERAWELFKSKADD